MTRKTPSHPSASAPVDTPEGFDDDGAEAGEIIERPDGYYWKAPEGPEEYGPFESYELALSDRDVQADQPPEAGEELHEAERNLGINEWIDADTGGLAEGQSPPHLEQE